MLRQHQVLELMAKERQYQDKTWPEDERRRISYRRLAHHLILLDVYVQKAKLQWATNEGDFTALQQVGKVAAIALRALEMTEGSEKLLEEGLR